MHIVNKKIFTDKSCGASFESDPFELDMIEHISFIGSFAGATVDGALKIQVSNEDKNAPDSNTVWIDYGSSVTVATGNRAIFEKNIPFKWAKLTFTRNAGTGTANIWACLKGY